MATTAALRWATEFWLEIEDPERHKQLLAWLAFSPTNRQEFLRAYKAFEAFEEWMKEKYPIPH